MTNNKKVKELIHYLKSESNMYYKITENSNKNGLQEYTVHNLQGETEKGVLLFSDEKEYITLNMCALMSIMIKTIIDIEYKDNLISIILPMQNIKIQKI